MTECFETITDGHYWRNVAFQTPSVLSTPWAPGSAGLPWHDAAVLRVGLTGGIGAGKSTVAARLAEFGAVLIDADRLAREVVEPGTEGLAAVVTAFGPGILAPDGTLDRAALGRTVFSDAAARSRLNGILHPRIGALTAERMRAAGLDALVVHDVPLLVENRLGAAYHLVLVVHAPVAERLRRLVEDRGLPAEDAAARIAVQADDDARRAAADVWLDNSGDRQRILDAVDRVWAGRIVPYAENLRHRRPAPAADPARPADAGLLGAPPPDAPALGRARDRLLRALGDAVPGATVAAAGGADGAGGAGGAEVHLVLGVPDVAAVRGLPERLADAGFLPVPGAGEAGWYRGADPGQPVAVRVVPAPAA
jgi:dephospho-CoA kinase